jgi:hypothetical protein
MERLVEGEEEESNLINLKRVELTHSVWGHIQRAAMRVHYVCTA